jgi:hypothetical protein
MVQNRLTRHPRFQFHFAPIRSRWLNMVGRFFRDLTRNRLRPGVFRHVEDLITAIGNYMDKHNKEPKTFIWTAKATDNRRSPYRLRLSSELSSKYA